MHKHCQNRRSRLILSYNCQYCHSSTQMRSQTETQIRIRSKLRWVCRLNAYKIETQIRLKLRWDYTDWKYLRALSGWSWFPNNWHDTFKWYPKILNRSAKSQRNKAVSKWCTWYPRTSRHPRVWTFIEAWNIIAIIKTIVKKIMMRKY